MQEDCQVKISREMSDHDWDRFVDSVEGASFAQTSLWAEVKGLAGWSVLRVLLIQDERIVAGAQILLRRISRLGFMGYLSSGPVLASYNTALRDRLLQEIARAARANKVRLLLMQPADREEFWAASAERQGFRLQSSDMLVGATLIVDLHPEPDEILMSMRRTKRQCIKGGLRKGIVVEPGGREDLPTFFSLMMSTCERQGVTPHPAEYSFFEVLWDRFSPHGMIQLFLARYEGEILAALLVIPCGKTAFAWKIGWSGQHRRLWPNEVVFWEAMRWSRQQGCVAFDFMGVDPRVADCLKAKEPLSDEMIRSPSFFKLGFGGDVVSRPGAFEFVPNPFLRWPYQHIVRRLYGSHTFRKLLHRIWGRLHSAKKTG